MSLLPSVHCSSAPFSPYLHYSVGYPSSPTFPLESVPIRISTYQLVSERVDPPISMSDDDAIAESYIRMQEVLRGIIDELRQMNAKSAAELADVRQKISTKGHSSAIGEETPLFVESLEIVVDEEVEPELITVEEALENTTVSAKEEPVGVLIQVHGPHEEHQEVEVVREKSLRKEDGEVRGLLKKLCAIPPLVGIIVGDDDDDAQEANKRMVLNMHDIDALEENIRIRLQAGTIQLGNRLYCSPMVLEKKKDKLGWLQPYWRRTFLRQNYSKSTSLYHGPFLRLSQFESAIIEMMGLSDLIEDIVHGTELEITPGDVDATLQLHGLPIVMVMENGNPVEGKNLFPNIEHLFKLFGYESVFPYLKGELRNAIATFVHVLPVLRDIMWSYLEQYDLPVVVSSNVSIVAQPISSVYDMQFELNEIEARNGRYPSTTSFVNLINTLITEERDVSDRGNKFMGIFKFIHDHVFGPFPQRAYADSHEKWQLVTACLRHFHVILRMYDIFDEDIDSVMKNSQTSVVAQPTSLQAQLLVLELLKGFMSGKTVFRNITAILLPGVNSIISERSSQTYGHLLEKALQPCRKIIVLVLEKDSSVSDFWHPLYQPLDVILSQDPNQVTCLLEYMGCDLQQQSQLSSIKIMSILSSRMVGLAQLLLTSDIANGLTEDYTPCLESRLEESHAVESSSNDHGVLIMQPRFHYSCLKIMLEALETLEKPDNKICPAEENVEAICQFFNSIGKQLDESPKSKKDAWEGIIKEALLTATVHPSDKPYSSLVMLDGYPPPTQELSFLEDKEIEEGSIDTGEIKEAR